MTGRIGVLRSRPRSCAAFALTALTALTALSLAQPASAQNRHVAIPATTLDVALTLLARATGADMISVEPGLRAIRTPAVQGDLSAVAALDRLLAHSGYRAMRIDGRAFRIVRAPVKPRKMTRQQVDAVAPSTDIVVTASKQRTLLLRYPGSLTVIDTQRIEGAAGAPDMTDIARATPVLQTTDLGPGRNKLFIRGIADSSFNGAAQSTASVYFGDVQLGYSGADPSLKLYDMRSVEILEGPQGTLYGSGSIGGIVRLTPNPVDLARTDAAAASGATFTRDGAPGFDVAGMVNVPITTDAVGLRVVGYHQRDGGYIDDPGRRQASTNRVDTTGGRAALKIDPGGGWRVDLQGLYQRIAGRDGQYVDRRAGDLQRPTELAQPFHASVGLGSVVVTKDWDGGLQLVSATSVASYHSEDLFDASALASPGVQMPLAYQTNGAKVLLTHETRMSRTLDSGSSWVTGFTVLRNRDAEARTFGAPEAPSDITGVTNVTKSASVFGEGTVAATPRLAVTLGTRLTIARIDGEPSFTARGNGFVHGRSTRRIDPTAALSWRIGPGLALFGRLQSGYRTGGLAVARGIGRVADFRSDSIRVGEIGIRRLRGGETGLALTAGLSFARWNDIQADLINRRGQPYTANIGNADVQALEATADWIPFRGLRATGALLYTDNEVMGAIADQSRPDNRRLPETPSFSGKADLYYEWATRVGVWSVGVSADYTGRSVLGTGDLLDISQGNFAAFGARAGWRRARLGVTFTADNLTNARGNRFAFGNPFSFAARDQVTPTRPFNMRIGVSYGW